MYLARTASGALVAFKELDPSRSHPRFADEVSAQEAAAGTGLGVLPVLNSHVPARGSRGGWLVTPVAEPLADHLSDATLEEVLAAVKGVASTLERLRSSAHKISHRDIKPSNLFWWDDQPVLGDFGLADFRGKADRTTNTRRLGPMYFQAPETLSRPLDAAGPPADVYSLAKTLWVLAIDQRWPPVGYQRLDYLPNLLSEALDRVDAYPLDVLLEQATREAPEERPSLQDVVDELAVWSEGVAVQENEDSSLEQYRLTLQAIRAKGEQDAAAGTLTHRSHGDGS